MAQLVGNLNRLIKVAGSKIPQMLHLKYAIKSLTKPLPSDLETNVGLNQISWVTSNIAQIPVKQNPLKKNKKINTKYNNHPIQYNNHNLFN